MTVREIADPFADFRLTVEEPGDACVLLPKQLYVPGTCARLTTAQPDAVLASLGKTKATTIVDVEIIPVDGWSYMLQILREDRPGQHDVDLQGAVRNADDIVHAMDARVRAAGVTLARVGEVDLLHSHDVQVVCFEARADAPPGPLTAYSHMVICAVVAREAGYQITFMGPEDHAKSLRVIADQTVRTLHATPAYRPWGSHAMTYFGISTLVVAVTFGAALWWRGSRRRD